MSFDPTKPNLGNKIGDDIPQIRENFELLEDSQVVDEGSTADGDYIRWENGLQICWGYKLGDIDTSDSSWQSISDYPASFDDVVFMALSPLRDDEEYSELIELAYDFVFNYSDRRSRWRISYRGSDHGILTEVVLFAIGRWK